MVSIRPKGLKGRFAVIIRVSAIAVLVFALLRLGLLIQIWHDAAPRLLDLLYIFGVGLVYDLAFLGYVSLPFVLLLTIFPNSWLQTRPVKAIGQAVVYAVIFGLFFSVVAEWLFWEEFGVRFNFIAVDYLVYRREVTDNIIESYHVPWILTNIFFVAGSLFIFLKKFLFSAKPANEYLVRRLVKASGILLIPGLSFLFLGQWQHNLSDNNYINELASNGPYQLFAAFRNNTLDYQQFYALGNDKTLSDKLKENILGSGIAPNNSGLYNIERYVESGKPEKRLNVILISVESLSAEFLSRFGGKEGETKFNPSITPFMDEWMPQGLLFTNFYATGTRTTRGLESITLSIPPTPGRSIVKRPDNDHMYSLGKVFKDKDYDVAFLYGGRGYFDNMNAFFSGNGYRIVDQTDLSNDEINFQNAWGVADGDLFSRTIREAEQAHQKGKSFFFHVMTTSNHRPFTFPEGAIDIPSGSGRDGGVKYTDFALGQFIREAKEKSWFDDTMFIVVADHCAASAGKVGLPVDKYHIPMFIYAPKYVAPGEVDRLASQIDLAPTILSLLNFSYDSFFFGKDILSPEFKGRALIANYQKLGLYDGKELIILSPRREIDLVSKDKTENVVRKVTASYPLVRELMPFYQGADYIIKNKLNRWTKHEFKYAFHDSFN